jgi:hypothetical protein
VAGREGIPKNCDIIPNHMALASSTRHHRVDLRDSARPSYIAAKEAATETDLSGLLFTRAFGISSSGNTSRPQVCRTTFAILSKGWTLTQVRPFERDVIVQVSDYRAFEDEYLLKIGLRDAEATSTSALQSPIFNIYLNLMVNSSRSSCSAMRQTLVEPRATVSCSESQSINRDGEHS